MRGDIRLMVAANAFTDAAGNHNATGASTTLAVRLAVSATTSIVAGANYVNLGNRSAFPVSGVAGPNAAIVITANDDDGATTTARATADDSGVWRGTVNLLAPVALADGEVRITATATEPDKAESAGSAVLTVRKDTVAPTITISANPTTLIAGGTATLSFNLSEASDDFDLNDLEVTGGGTLGALSSADAGVSYTARYIAPATTSDVTITITVTANAFADAAGNGTVSTALSIPVTPRPRTAAPTISTPANNSILRTAALAAVTVAGTAEAGARVAITAYERGNTGNAIASPVTTQALATTGVWSSTLNLAGATLVANGDIVIAVRAQAAGELESAAATVTVTKDTAAPTITLSANLATIEVGGTATVTFTLSEANTDFSLAEVTVTGGGRLSALSRVNGTDNGSGGSSGVQVMRRWLRR